MEDSSLLNIISEKWVKPSSPTPPSSRYYKFSVFDAFMVDSFVPLCFFYPKESFHGLKSSSRAEVFELLETSLAKTLTYYYPFAGRFMEDNVTVDCNDFGVQLWEVQIRASMSEILDNRAKYHPWNMVILPEMYTSLKSHMKVQLNYFECGGICVGISMSHKLGEALVTCNFVNDWAKITHGLQEILPPPSPPAPILSGASIFPPPDHHYSASQTTFTTSLAENSPFVTQRFVFSSSNISKLKKMVVTNTEIKNPSQTEVLTAFIFKFVVSATSRSNNLGSFKPSSLLQTASFRQITIPPLSEQYIGNFVSKFVVTATDEKETTLSRLVTELRKSKVEFQNIHRICLEGRNDEFLSKYYKYWEESEKKLIGDRYRFTSIIRFPFYETDFGFGKPIFVWIGGGLAEEVIVLIDSASGDGIEAFITLKKDTMSIIEHDEELLAFASLNPIICASN